MSLTKYTGATNTIQSLSDQPNQIEGLTPAQLKIKFDQFAIDMKAFLNSTMTTEIETQFATNVALQQVIAGQVNIVDPITGKKYVYVVENGSPGIKEVG